MSAVLYTVNLYICVFMTCSTSYCLCDTLMDPWNACVHTHTHTHTHLYVAFLFYDLQLLVVLVQIICT
jgi:hypothetical protein